MRFSLERRTSPRAFLSGRQLFCFFFCFFFFFFSSQWNRHRWVRLLSGYGGSPVSVGFLGTEAPASSLRRCADVSHECVAQGEKTRAASQLHPLQPTTAEAFRARSEITPLLWSPVKTRLLAEWTESSNLLVWTSHVVGNCLKPVTCKICCV